MLRAFARGMEGKISPKRASLYLLVFMVPGVICFSKALDRLDTKVPTTQPSTAATQPADGLGSVKVTEVQTEAQVERIEKVEGLTTRRAIIKTPRGYFAALSDDSSIRVGDRGALVTLMHQTNPWTTVFVFLFKPTN